MAGDTSDVALITDVLTIPSDNQLAALTSKRGTRQAVAVPQMKIC